MDTTRFDRITSTFAQSHSRRGALRLLAAATLGAGGLSVLATDEGQAKKRRKGKGKGKGNDVVITPDPSGGTGTVAPEPIGSTGAGGSVRALRQICTPGNDTCSSGLQCDAPTSRHTCSSTVKGIASWCCVPPGGECSECDCCGNNYCSYDDNNVGHCVPNPEN